MKIPAINDLKRHTAALSSEINDRLQSVVESGWFVLGKNVDAFETSFAKYCGSNHCVTVANGTEALELALKALGLGSDKRVATVANGGMYSTMAILATGASPLYVDIDPATLTMSMSDLELKLQTEKVDGIIITHLYGQLSDVHSLLVLARQYDIPVIEDCAQAHGASLNGRKAGSFGDIGCFSFYPTKNLGAIGDGGATVTNDPGLNQKLRQLRQYGWGKKYEVVLPGGKNSRLDELQAAVLNIKLPLLDSWNARRRAIVELIYKSCTDVKSVRLPSLFDTTYVAHLLVVRTEKRAELQTFLKNKNIQTEVHYPIADHRQPVFKGKYNGTRLPFTEDACERILTLPCFPEMTDVEAKYIADCLIEFEKCSL